MKGRDKNGDVPTRTTRNAGGQSQRFNGAQFVQYELDKAQQAECKAWSISFEDILLEIEAQIEAGYKFTIKWDTYNECYGVFMQAASEGSPNFGSILTGRGSTVSKSLKQVLYKHRVCLQGDWSGYLERRGRDVLDD